MDLNQHHREALLHKLEETKGERDRNRDLLNSGMESDTLESSRAWTEIAIYLSDERVKLIEKAIIENQIDF